MGPRFRDLAPGFEDLGPNLEDRPDLAQSSRFCAKVSRTEPPFQPSHHKLALSSRFWAESSRFCAKRSRTEPGHPHRAQPVTGGAALRGSALVLEDWAQILQDWAQIPEDGLQILEDWTEILEDWLQSLDGQAQIHENWLQIVEDWVQMPEDSPESSPKPRGLKPRNTLGTKCSFLPPLSRIGPHYGPDQPSGNRISIRRKWREVCFKDVV